MNEICRVSVTDELARIQAIMARHMRPELVSGFHVEFGEYDDEPAMWIVFQTATRRPIRPEERKARGQALRDLKEAVHQDLVAEIAGFYPYYRFTDAAQS